MEAANLTHHNHQKDLKGPHYAGAFFKPVIQTKLSVNEPGDRYEREADAMADRVMRMTDTTVNQGAFFKPANNTLQRKCQHCEEEEKQVRRKEENGSEVQGSNDLDSYVSTLSSSGQLLPETSMKFFGPRFGHDFSNVRVHTDGAAARSAQSINALAYTSGNNIVFNSGQFSPESDSGKKLMAHELTHVIQQSGPASGAQRHELNKHDGIQKNLSGNVVARANTNATATVLRTGTARTSGIQFFPLQVASTRIGPVSGQGGLIDDARNRLSVIVGQGMTLRRIAGIVLPLWNSAAPFTPPNSTPLITPPIDADVLARGLLVYNQYYLQVLPQAGQTLTKWTGGLRFPLPVEIDQNNEGVVNKDLISSLSGSFNAVWEPLLDQTAAANAALPAANLQTSVTDFLTTNADATARGMGLSTRAITNPVESSPFITEAFRQLGANGFDVALAFMDSSVNSQIALLASQTTGAAILGVIRSALAAAPASLSATQRDSLTRANLMLGLVSGVTARPMPFAQPNAISAAGAHMVASFEGFCPNLYDDASRGCGRGAGHCTIGYGHLVHHGICNGTDASEAPFLGGITVQQGEQLVATELAASAGRVSRQITVPISQQQFDALVSFDFNTGRLNALAPDINGNHFDRIPGIMNQFTHSQGVELPGLVTRRAQEGTLFSTGAYP